MQNHFGGEQEKRLSKETDANVCSESLSDTALDLLAQLLAFLYKVDSDLKSKE